MVDGFPEGHVLDGLRQLLQGFQGDGVLTAGPGVERRRRQHIELPLADVERVDRLLDDMCQDGEHLDVGLAPRFFLLLIGFPIPSQRLRHNEANRRQGALVPALDVGSRFHFYFEARGRQQIERRPFVTDAVGREPQGAADEVFRQSATRDIAHEIRGAPLPETQQVETEILAALVEVLGPCLSRYGEPPEWFDYGSFPRSLNGEDCRSKIFGQSPEFLGRTALLGKAPAMGCR